MIETELGDELTDEVAHKESVRARKLATAHVALNASPNVYIVECIDEMLEASVALYGVARTLVELSHSNNPAFQRFMEGRRQSEAFAAAMASGQLGQDAAKLASRRS